MTSFKYLARWCYGLVVISFLFETTANTAETNYGLSANSKGGLLLKGKSYRGIGVNYYDAFARLLENGKISEVEAGFRVLASNQIPFIRFSAGGYWPVNWGLYQTNRAEYFERLDHVVKLAETHEVGLIPSLFWHQPTISDLVGEPVSLWGDAASKTHELMRTYTREVVTRYKNSPAIWAWEFGNEFNLPADLPNAAQHRPAIVPKLGTPSTRSSRDDLSHRAIRVALEEFAREVRRHDADRLILSGNAFPRPSAWHQQHDGTWKSDSTEQRLEMLLADNPSPVSTLSGRLYSTNDLVFLRPAMEKARQVGKPLIIGEFGVEGMMTELATKQFQKWLDALDASGVPMAALWVFDFPHQKEWSITGDNDRKEQLQMITRMNARWRGANRGL